MTRSRTVDTALYDVAVRWWAAARPHGWTAEHHALNPYVNRAAEHHDLCAAVVDAMRERGDLPREDDAPSAEPPEAA